MCGPPHPAGWVPGDNAGTAEGATLSGNHPLLRQRQGKKKKKTSNCSSVFLFTCTFLQRDKRSITFEICGTRNLLQVVSWKVLCMALQLVLLSRSLKIKFKNRPFLGALLKVRTKEHKYLYGCHRELSLEP